MPFVFRSRPVPHSGLRAVATLSLLACLAGCAPVLVGSAVVGTTVVATDRRTTGIQLEDQSIEMKVRSAINEHYGDKAQVTPSSYNRNVLLVGTAGDEAARERIGRIAAAVENVASVSNQVVVGEGRTLTAGANDSWISGQVRAALIGTAGLPSNVFVITTNSGVVYLQGRVTQAEGDTAARVAASIRGVQKVVKLFEYMSEEEARTYSSNSESNATSGAAPAVQQPSSLQTSGGSAIQPGTGAQVIPVPAAP